MSRSSGFQWPRFQEFSNSNRAGGDRSLGDPARLGLESDTRTTGAIHGSSLLSSLSAADRALLEPSLEPVALQRGVVWSKAGVSAGLTLFPLGPATVSLSLLMQDGRLVEAASIGREGAVGGVVFEGREPAFAHAMVQIGGPALAIDSGRLEAIASGSQGISDLFARYRRVVFAQLMQSVVCNARHALLARYARCLLTLHDRALGGEVRATQEALASSLGVQRSSVTEVASALRGRGVIGVVRGRIRIRDRAQLEHVACECYAAVGRQFEASLPEGRFYQAGRITERAAPSLGPTERPHSPAEAL